MYQVVWNDFTIDKEYISDIFSEISNIVQSLFIVGSQLTLFVNCYFQSSIDLFCYLKDVYLKWKFGNHLEEEILFYWSTSKYIIMLLEERRPFWIKKDGVRRIIFCSSKMLQKSNIIHNLFLFHKQLNI